MKKNVIAYLEKVQVKPGKKFSLGKDHQTSNTEKIHHISKIIADLFPLPLNAVIKNSTSKL